MRSLLGFRIIDASGIIDLIKAVPQDVISIFLRHIEVIGRGYHAGYSCELALLQVLEINVRRPLLQAAPFEDGIQAA